MSSVSKNIKKMRLQRKLTQEEMAHKLFVTRQTISNWENGKSQPDIDTLIKIADTLDTDITALIYGLPDSAVQKREKKHLVFAGGILLILGIPLYFLTTIANDMKMDFFSEPMVFLRLFLLPIFLLVLGWAIMQGLGVLGVIKPTKSKYNKAIHVAALVIVSLYAVLMLPYFKESIKAMVQLFQYRQNPSLYPDGYQYAYNIPGILLKVEWSIINVVYKQPIIFVIPSIIFWLSKPINQER